MLHTTLGNTRLLARPDDRRLWLLDAGTAAIWDLYVSGWTGEPLADLLTEHFGVNPNVTRDYLDKLFAQWQVSGLLSGENTELGSYSPPMEALPRLPIPDRIAIPSGAWRLRLADQIAHLAVNDSMLRTAIRSLLAPLIISRSLDRELSIADQESPDYTLVVQGDTAHWSIMINGVSLETGHGHDAALLTMLTLLTEIGCQTRERMLVVHGAGLIHPNGLSFLLIAPGGAGKSTLAAALNAMGYGLLSDDVVPVTPDGALLGLGLPCCLKAGSWSVLAAYWPELGQVPVVHRFGQGIRYLPPRGSTVTGPIKPSRLLFPRFCPGHSPSIQSLSPELALQGLVRAEAVIRDLTQTKLEALAHWMSTTPAYALTYPDLDSGLILVQALMKRSPVESTEFT